MIKIGKHGRFRVAFRPGTSDVAVLKQSFDEDIFFSSVPEYEPGPGHIIIDVGAHIGTFSLQATSLAADGKVYAIEPCRDSCKVCRVSIAINRLSERIELSHLALSDRKGVCRLYHDHGNWGHTIIAPRTRSAETVQTETLGRFLASRQIERCHFMKMNCDGAEFPVILSSPCEVLRKIEVMLILYHCDIYAEKTEDDLVAHLSACGFKTSLRNQTEKRGWIVATQRGDRRLKRTHFGVEIRPTL